MTQHYSFRYDFQAPVDWHSARVSVPKEIPAINFIRDLAHALDGMAKEDWHWSFRDHSWRTGELLFHFASKRDADRAHLIFHDYLPDLFS